MNWEQIEGNWERLKGTVKQTWGKLTDDDLMVIQGHESELAGKLQERYGYAKERTQEELKRFMQKCEEKLSKASNSADKLKRDARSHVKNGV